jgi:hypothetical protein
MGFLNYTGHSVTLIVDGAVFTFLPLGPVARCVPPGAPVRLARLVTPAGAVTIPIYAADRYGTVIDLPAPELCDGVNPCRFCRVVDCGDANGIRDCDDAPRYIVSSRVVDALPERSDLFAPRNLVREGARTVGCRGLRQAV